VYDFYKPILSSAFPLVDGPLSLNCYLHELWCCVDFLNEKVKEKKDQEKPVLASSSSSSSFAVNKYFNISDYSWCIFHSPFNKMIKKAFSLLVCHIFVVIVYL
jgi:hydroxymethylglutaryl-CoA synthase